MVMLAILNGSSSAAHPLEGVFDHTLICGNDCIVDGGIARLTVEFGVSDRVDGLYEEVIELVPELLRIGLGQARRGSLVEEVEVREASLTFGALA